MIIREIVTDEKLIDNFDFFNDYKDTRNWLILRIERDKLLLDKLDEYNKIYLDTPF